MAEFHRKTRGIVVLHRCMLNQQTWHSTDALSGYQAHLANQGCVDPKLGARDLDGAGCQEQNQLPTEWLAASQG